MTLKDTAKGIEKDIDSMLKNSHRGDSNQILPDKNQPKISLKQYKENKDAILVKNIKNSADMLRNTLLDEIALENENKVAFREALGLIDTYETQIAKGELLLAKNTLAQLQRIKLPAKKGIKFANSISFGLSFPIEIREHMNEDLAEAEKTFDSKCYRASIIICGRILETALHRKYFEATGEDILEKHPEIGLGKIIAKLEEKNVQLPPGLTQQIHLINQARIFSVHKKKDSFYPSKEQAYATILFTIDVLKKLF